MVDHGYVLPTRGIVLDSDGAQDQLARTQSCSTLARAAESMGFESVWAGDSVLAKPRLDPLSTTLAAVAAETDAIELGTAIHLPHLRRPVAVAQQAATVDLLSGGRLSLGVGVGSGASVATEHEQLGVPFDRRGRVLDETLDVIRGLWDGAIDTRRRLRHARGRRYRITADRELPIYVASATFDPRDGYPKQIRRRLADHGDGWLPISKSPEMYAGGIDRAREIVDDAGRNPSAFGAAYYQDIVIDETREAALDQARDFIAAYYPEWGQMSDEQLERRGAFGPPSSVVAEHLERYADAGVETFVTRFATTDQHAQLRRFRELL